MFTLKYPHLNEPLRLGGNMYQNRLFASPQDYPGLTAEGFLTEEASYFYERKALGGFSSVCVGDFMLDPDFGRSHPFQMRGLDPRGKVNLTRVATAIKRHGAAASIELNGAGDIANPMLYPAGSEPIAYGPSAYIRYDGVEVREMTEEQIEAMIQRYADGAAFAVQCGYNHLLIHGGHGWEIHQFMSPTSNHRTDRWGGSLENRMRLPLAIIDAIRKEVGRRVPIEFRMSGAEFIPNGYSLDEGVAMAQLLDGKVDLIHVSAGHHEVTEGMMHTHPTLFMPDGVNLNLAAEIKKHVKTPVATVGAHTALDAMEEILASGQADVIALGRQSLADPDLPLKARLGKPEDVTTCMRCFNCFNNSVVDGVFYCAANPEIGREEAAMYTPAPRFSKKVLVIGGGPGGMQCALTAAQRGHQVTLVEKTNRLGGCLLCEEGVPFKANLMRYLKGLAGKVQREPGIEVITNFEATPGWAAQQNADVVVTAVGSKPFIIPLPGIEKAQIADDVYMKPELAGQNVVIIGGGLVGLESGIFLAQQGRDVTVVEAAPATVATPPAPPASGEEPKGMPGLMHLPAGFPLVHGDALSLELAKLPNMQVLCSTKAVRVEDAGLVVCGPDGAERLIEGDTVICAAGQSPLWDLGQSFRLCAPEFYQIGDCVAPANIYEATSKGYQIAMDLGRI